MESKEGKGIPIPNITSEGSAQRKSQGVYEAIRDDIVSLRLVPGSMIYENELVEELGISRTPIREAIRLLVSEGLLEVLPQRGTRIARISLRKVAEARFIRGQLELGAFRLAARLWHPGEHGGVKAEAEELLAKQREAAEAGDAARFLQLDEAFHQAVIGVNGNATLQQVITQMRGHLNRLRCLALRQYHYMPQMIEEHQGLLEAVEQGNEALAAERLEHHLGKLDVELPELRSAYPDYFQE
ncbi:GntR family transcriptional regulator [Paenibacillus mucilaginosus 3016]|uniref:GntR family transcriptional regulator n=1 Tax=Paenibacillus mucilaginosus 3016 TaxID=1116391 RepID=H6NKU4_9BACL|nr:FCD domain-containing protein [Paenibacillus mucilaginosus]AFC29250.1 GntR family transcriptional regulator [Paenibacillus mucilaginosus 3016]WFA17976.1 GntR family transcriptional regulator [Paenibacillus mucilaginosus]